MGTDFKMLCPWPAVIALFFAISPTIGGEREKVGTIKLNVDALGYAEKLIGEGDVVKDNHGAWRGHKTSRQQENEFIRQHGFDEYAKWHLGIDERHAENSKARYKFPYGDFKELHRCALLAVKSRARQYGYSEIETAADKLLREMNSAKNPPKSVKSTLHPTP